MINKELALRMNADFGILSRDENEPPYRSLPYSRYVSRPQEMISNKTNYTKYSDKTVLEIMKNTMRVPDIKDVIFNPPATIVLWADGTKTVVKCQEDEGEYSKEVGLAMCICKKVYGNKGNYNNVFKKFIKEY